MKKSPERATYSSPEQMERSKMSLWVMMHHEDQEPPLAIRSKANGLSAIKEIRNAE